MEALWRESALAWRRLSRSRGFALVVVLTLALGIGANTVIFSLVEGVLLKPLPYCDPDRLVRVWENNAALGLQRFNVSPPNFRDWSEQSRSFKGMVMVGQRPFTLTAGQEPERLAAERVSAGYFELLGIRPFLGRGFALGEDSRARSRIAVLSEGFWRRRFGGDPGLLGRSLVLDGEAYLVIGILRDPLQPEVDLWTPLDFDLGSMPRGIRRVGVLARLERGVTAHQAQQEMSAIADRLARQFPDDDRGWGTEVAPLREVVVQNFRPVLLTLFAVVGFVLLICWVNVANLFLARLAAQEKEITIAMALGSGRSRLLLQFLAESLLLALAGGLAGLLLAAWAGKAFLAANGARIPRAVEVGLDLRVLGFAFGVSLLLALALGMVPVLATRRLDFGHLLKTAGVAARSGSGGSRMRQALVVAEVALALVPMIAAGLLTRSLIRLQTVDPGFKPGHVLTAQISLPKARYGEAERKSAFYLQALERAARLPGVVATGAVSPLPLTGADHLLEFTVEGRRVASSGQRPSAHLRVASPDYFRAMGIPLLAGRAFQAADVRGRRRVAVINQTLAHREWPQESPLGKRISFGDDPTDKDTLYEVVGVVGDVKSAALDEEPGMEAYMSAFQEPGDSAVLVLRTAVDPAGLAGPLRREVLALDPVLPVYKIATLEQIVHDSLASPRLRTQLIGSFAVLALILASIGIYGVLSFHVTLRRNEIGIRMALGATRPCVLRLVLGQVLKLVLEGELLGLLAALFLSRLLAGFLFGVSVGDPLIYLLISALLVGFALLASYLPVRSATRVDPKVALNAE
jgi:putative ABC transport system permease protein